jgi:signal transduction histidine kinase
MTDTDASAYLRLNQFLELEKHWLTASSRTELAHRICHTAASLLDAPGVALGIAGPGDSFEILASQGTCRESAADDVQKAGFDSAVNGSTPRLESSDDGSVGVFPFHVGTGGEGRLYVRLSRPVFRDLEISFLRFLASVAGLVMRTWSESNADEDAQAGGVASHAGPNGAPVNGVSETAARRYVAMAVHDLRNPLNVIAGYTALLDEETLGTLTVQQREAVDAIKRQSRTLLKAVDHLLELDRMPKTPQRAVSRFEVRELFDELRRTCFAHSTARITWPGPEVAFDFSCDRRRLFSIAQNLIDNALKHTADGEIVVSCARSNGCLVLNVRDQGPGLDPDLRSTLITHANSGVETAPRSGLGLYTLASHVHALNGEIEIEAGESGTGTDIEVRIPMKRFD